MQIEAALTNAAAALRSLKREFAVVGGLAVSVRSEARFTRDVDIAVAVADDRDAEQLVHALGGYGYRLIALVEHEERGRLATTRLAHASGVVVDLLFASSGLEGVIVERATAVEFPGGQRLPVARAEELLAMKVLSMTERRLQDRADALNLLEMSEGLDLDAVRENLARITQRGFDRGLDLHARLDELLAQTESR